MNRASEPATDPPSRSHPFAIPPARAAMDGSGAAHRSLVDLFLDPAPATESMPPRRLTQRVDLLLVGHLPVRAAPWITQYCRALADRDGASVACLRRSGSYLSIDWFSSGADAPEPVEDPMQALRTLARGDARVVLQADEHADRGLAVHPAVGTITVLSGANDAALVAAYRILKEAQGSHDNGRAVPTPTPQGPELRVAVMGASLTDAEAQVRRLSDTARAFLGKGVSLALAVERIIPAHPRTLYRGVCDTDPSRLLDALLECSQRDPSAPSPADLAQVAPSDGVPPSLASHLPGLEPWAIRCPSEPTVELAWDERGMLHLLAAEESADPIAALLSARVWAVAHAPLLALAARRPACEAPAAHLFTRDPARWQRLRSVGFEVHLLVPPQQQWCRIDHAR